METLLKILMVEDQEEDATLVIRCLKKSSLNFDTIRVDNKDDFIKTLNSFNPDVVLSDHSLPQFNSIEALKICRSIKPDIPFILVTGTVSEEFAVKSLKEGADDYILKSNLIRLPSAINNALQQHWLEKERKTQHLTLERKNHELEKANKELDAFVYNLTHSLRSPLTSVLGLTIIAKLEPDFNKAEFVSYFDMIEKCITSLDDAVKNILHYSQNTKLPIKISPINIIKLIDTVLNDNSIKEEITVNVNIEDVEIIYTDEYRLQIIIHNILDNANLFKNTTEDSFINISVREVENFIEITIEDNGIGILENQMEGIFDMFFRASPTSQGAGLGLYIVKEMLNKLKGSISISSELTKGSIFKVKIPNLINSCADE